MKCTLPHCTRTAHAKGLCVTHYSRRRLDAENWDAPILAPRQAKGLDCKQGGCGRAVYALGWCRLHYNRSRSGVEMDSLVRWRAKEKTRMLPTLVLPADVYRAIEAEAESRALTVYAVAREKLTALMRLKASERRRALEAA